MMDGHRQMLEDDIIKVRNTFDSPLASGVWHAFDRMCNMAREDASRCNHYENATNKRCTRKVEHLSHHRFEE